MPGGAALEWTWFPFRRTQKSWHSRHHPRVSKPERRQVTIISGDGSFCARRLPVCHTFPPAYRIQIVGFVCYSDGAHMQISVFEFRHFGCGEGALCKWARLPRVRLKAAVSFEPRSFSRRSMICAVAQRVWRTMLKPLSQELGIIKMGVLLRVSTILRLRDHLYAQEQMFTRRAARDAFCFCVRIHGVMASPPVMLKDVFLLEVTLEGWLIARRQRCFVRSEWRAS